jgi:putative transposase
MSRAGNCYDNAAMESFIGTLKTECITGQFESRAQARTAIFEYIEVWYNQSTPVSGTTLAFYPQLSQP